MSYARYGNVRYWRFPRLRLTVIHGVFSGKVHVWFRGRSYRIRKADYDRFARKLGETR